MKRELYESIIDKIERGNRSRFMNDLLQSSIDDSKLIREGNGNITKIFLKLFNEASKRIPEKIGSLISILTNDERQDLINYIKKASK